MICTYCNNSNTKVVDKRDSDEEPVSRRRRECLKCTKRFTTYERVESIDIKVVKKDGTTQDYERNKIFHGISLAVQDRVDHNEVEKIVDDIEIKLFNRKSSEISSSDIGRMILTRLKNRDLVSYMRFASVFLDFDNLEEFKEEIEKLQVIAVAR